MEAFEVATLRDTSVRCAALMVGFVLLREQAHHEQTIRLIGWHPLGCFCEWAVGMRDGRRLDLQHDRETAE